MKFQMLAICLLLAGCAAQSNISVQQPVTNDSSVKEFRIIAQMFSFNPGTIEVNQGDKVRLIVKSVDVPHGFAIKEYNIKEYLAPQEEVVIEFVADKAGTFRFYCSVPCGKDHKAMNGTLVVTA